MNKSISLNWSPLKYHNVYDKQELHNILIDYQDNLCPICFKELSQNSKELDHEPSIYVLRDKIWLELTKLILGNSSKSNTDLKFFEKLVSLSKIKIEQVILDQKLYLRSVHSKCHKTIDKGLSKKEIRWRSRIKKLIDKSLFYKIIAIRDDIKSFIKGWRKLSYFQIKEISLKRNLNKKNVYYNL